MKNNIKVISISLVVVTIVLFISLGLKQLDIKNNNALSFLKKYYTTDENVDLPNSIQELELFKKEYSHFFDDKELERLIKNRIILEPINASKNGDCLLQVKNVSIIPIEGKYAEYNYLAEVIAIFQDGKEQSIFFEGVIIKESEKRNAKIIKFMPSNKVEDLIK